MEIRATSLEAASALAWLANAGADVIVENRPRNWLAEPVARPAPPVQTPARAAVAAAAAPTAALGADITDLHALDAALIDFVHPLRQPVPPQLLTGATDSGLIVLLDQPEAPDAPVSQLLARMLAAIGLDAGTCATGHLLPWATPAGRPPRDEEIAAFAPFVHRALILAAPRAILAFGDRAANLATQSQPTQSQPTPARGIASTRGKWLTFRDTPMIATFHPRQLLAQPELKRLAWADLQAFAARVAA